MNNNALSDNVPVAIDLISSTNKKQYNAQFVYKRIMKNFCQTEFLLDLANAKWEQIVLNPRADVHEKAKIFDDLFRKVLSLLK